MKIRPLLDNIVIKPFEGEQQVNGLFIPDTAQEKPQEGVVIAIGPGNYSSRGERLELDVSEGDKVLYGKYSGTTVEVNGEKLLILHQNDILAILESEEENGNSQHAVSNSKV